jgi:mannose-1-phosphate guanylyltransferase
MHASDRWAVILAGGNGSRIQTLTRLVAGDERPKQFCRLVGNETLLAATRARIAQTVASDHTLCVVTSHHESFYRGEFNEDDWTRLVEQPVNRGTGIAIAYAVTRVAGLDPNGIIGFFPADHHYDDGVAFRQVVDEAYAVARLDGSRVFMVGAEAERPDVEYGWITRGARVPELTAERTPLWISDVAGFVEKPSQAEADALYASGSLWNTFVLTGHVRAFRALLDAALPGLCDELAAILDLPEPHATAALGRLYASPIASDFARDVLSRHPNRLAVIELAASGWTDLGQPAHALRVMERCGFRSPDTARLAM